MSWLLLLSSVSAIHPVVAPSCTFLRLAARDRLIGRKVGPLFVRYRAWDVEKEEQLQMTTSGVDAVPRAQDDLFRHVNGQWLARESIPEDQSIYGAFHEMRDRSEAECREIVEQAAENPGEPGSAAQLIGDLYASFMDEATVEAEGGEPAWQHLRELDAVETSWGSRVYSAACSGTGFRACSASASTPTRTARTNTRGVPPGRSGPA